MTHPFWKGWSRGFRGADSTPLRPTTSVVWTCSKLRWGEEEDETRQGSENERKGKKKKRSKRRRKFMKKEHNMIKKEERETKGEEVKKKKEEGKNIKVLDHKTYLLVIKLK